MYFDDHGHPHFHARRAGAEAKIRIDEIGVIASVAGPRPFSSFWHGLSRIKRKLPEHWQRARASETLLKIEPLR